MNNNILVSICCLTYNHRKFIEDALEGFLMQKTTFKYEILIHDDASNDGTVKILKIYEKKYPELIKIIYQKENQYSKGIIPTKFLFEKAKGKYLAICEGDDYWITEKKLQKQIDFLEKNLEYSASYHNILYVDKYKKRLYGAHQTFHPFYVAHTITKKDIEKVYLCGQTASIVCKNFWKEWNEEKKEVYTKCKAPEDGKLSLILTMLGDVYFFEEIMSCYRLTLDTDSWSSKNKNKNPLKLHYQFLLELKKLSKEFYNYSYNIDINKIILGSFIYSLKNISLKNIKIFFKLLNESNNKFNSLYYIVKNTVLKCLEKLNLKERKTYWPLIDEKKYLKGTIYEE